MYTWILLLGKKWPSKEGSLVYPLRKPVKKVTHVTARRKKAVGGPICELFPQCHAALPGVLLCQLSSPGSSDIFLGGPKIRKDNGAQG